MSGGSARRAAGVAAGAAVLGAAAVAGGAVLTWWTAQWTDTLVGPVTTAATGSDVVPELLPLALVGLAGWAAAAATRGRWRRVIGVVLALGGLWLAGRAVLAVLSPPDALAAALVRPAQAVGDPTRNLPGPALTVLGGMLLAVAGLLLAARPAGPPPPRSGVTSGSDDGSAPARPSPRRRDAGDTTDDWWKDLDAGTDPTTRPAGGP
ncbi:Trp biosynthesis-associated membrane protein [Nakamurella flava]|uniref:Trp biosynthesis-associated membrane protein n=1 Tax=Nakamurella flava TaxID=2576308 RepID=UPI001408F811|nr:Trp biosynthesis-associated membrane protein [Nakamurella flava]